MPNRRERWCQGRGLRFDWSVVRSCRASAVFKREVQPTLTLEDVAVVESGGENLDQDLICIRLRCNQRCKDSESATVPGLDEATGRLEEPTDPVRSEAYLH